VGFCYMARTGFAGRTAFLVHGNPRGFSGINVQVDYSLNGVRPTWVNKTPETSKQREGPSAWTENGRLYVAGGLVNNVGDDSLVVLDPPDTWSNTDTPMSGGRSFATTAQLGDIGFMITGIVQAGTYTREVRQVDLSNPTPLWSDSTPSGDWFATSGDAVGSGQFTIGDNCYVIGGFRQSANYFQSNYKLDLTGSPLVGVAEVNLSARASGFMNPGCAAYDGKGYLFCGMGRSSGGSWRWYTDSYVFEDGSPSTWTALSWPRFFGGRFKMFTFNAANGVIWLFGGQWQDFRNLSDVHGFDIDNQTQYHVGPFQHQVAQQWWDGAGGYFD